MSLMHYLASVWRQWWHGTSAALEKTTAAQPQRPQRVAVVPAIELVRNRLYREIEAWLTSPISPRKPFIYLYIATPKTFLQMQDRLQLVVDTLPTAEEQAMLRQEILDRLEGLSATVLIQEIDGAVVVTAEWPTTESFAEGQGHMVMG